VSGFVVLAVVLLLQWLIYDDWLHRSGPLRIVGGVMAGVLTFVFALRWQSAMRERKIEMLRRFETIQRMNDRIRNALQIIECATYATNPHATEPVRNAVDVIEGVLQEVLVEAHPASAAAPAKSAAPPKSIANQKPA
jgi:phosphate/sulfate permease